jgi:folate-dependent tRNA-U54 methylase TrmFO/GidA
MNLDKAIQAKATEILIRHLVDVYRISEAKDGAIVIETKPVATDALRTQLFEIFGGRTLRFELLPDNWNQTMKSANDPMTKAEYMAFHQECCNKMIAITKAKNSDYTGDSGDPFANFAQIGGLVQLPGVIEIGFLTRMSDKISRIGSFVTKGTLQVKDESVEDTLLDLANYCLLFAGYLRSKRQA